VSSKPTTHWRLTFHPPPSSPGWKHAAKGDKFTHYWKVTAFQPGGEKWKRRFVVVFFFFFFSSFLDSAIAVFVLFSFQLGNRPLLLLLLQLLLLLLPLLPGVKTQSQKHAAKGDKFTHYWKVTAFQPGGEKWKRRFVVVFFFFSSFLDSAIAVFVLFFLLSLEIARCCCCCYSSSSSSSSSSAILRAENFLTAGADFFVEGITEFPNRLSTNQVTGRQEMEE